MPLRQDDQLIDEVSGADGEREARDRVDDGQESGNTSEQQRDEVHGEADRDADDNRTPWQRTEERMPHFVAVHERGLRDIRACIVNGL